MAIAYRVRLLTGAARRSPRSVESISLAENTSCNLSSSHRIVMREIVILMRTMRSVPGTVFDDTDVRTLLCKRSGLMGIGEGR
jgi:hypothetical protein